MQTPCVVGCRDPSTGCFSLHTLQLHLHLGRGGSPLHSLMWTFFQSHVKSCKARSKPLQTTFSTPTQHFSSPTAPRLLQLCSVGSPFPPLLSTSSHHGQEQSSGVRWQLRNPGSALCWLCDLGQIAYPHLSLVSPSIKWAQHYFPGLLDG